MELKFHNYQIVKEYLCRTGKLPNPADTEYIEVLKGILE